MTHNQKPDEGTIIVAFSKEEAMACSQVMQLKGEIATPATCYSFNEIPADVKGNLIIAAPIVKGDEKQHFTQAVEMINRLATDKLPVSISFQEDDFGNYMAHLSPQPIRKENYLIEDYISADHDRSRLLKDVCNQQGIGERVKIVEPGEMVSFKYELGSMLEKTNLEKIAGRCGFTRDEQQSDNVKTVLRKDNEAMLVWRDEKSIYRYQDMNNPAVKGTAKDFLQKQPSVAVTAEDFKGHRLIASNQGEKIAAQFIRQQLQPGKAVGNVQELPKARGMQM